MSTRFAAVIALFFSVFAPNLALSGGQLDMGKILIGRGNSRATYTCSSGDQFTFVFELDPIQGPVLKFATATLKTRQLPRYIPESDAELHPCLSGILPSGETLTVCYRTPGVIDSIDFHPAQLHCLVQDVTRN